MESYNFLFIIAIILLATKIFGLSSQKVHMPQVVGALLVGILLGPGCLGILHETDFLLQTAEIGVILLMFQAGLDTEFDELKKAGKASLVIALIGVIVPFSVEQEYAGCSFIHQILQRKHFYRLVLLVSF